MDIEKRISTLLNEDGIGDLRNKAVRFLNYMKKDLNLIEKNIDNKKNVFEYADNLIENLKELKKLYQNDDFLDDKDFDYDKLRVRRLGR